MILRKRTQGQALTEHMVAMAIGVVVLVVAWRAYAVFSRQDEISRKLADRLQVTALVQQLVARDVEARCRYTAPRVEDNGCTLVLPACQDPSGPADGPRGSEEIRWELSAKGLITRNGRGVGPAATATLAFTFLHEPTVATLAVTMTWSDLPGQKATGDRTRVAHSWALPKEEATAPQA